MHRELFLRAVVSYPQAFIDSFEQLLEAAIYFQGLSILLNPKYIENEVWEKHSLVVSGSSRLSSLLAEGMSNESLAGESDVQKEA